MAREYSIWNATVASLQFWTADLDPVTLGRATEHIYTTFFYSPSSHTLHQQSNKILFGCFVITLNAASDQQLSLADEGHESGSDTINLPTPLRKTPQIHHVSSMEHTSFDPAPATPCSDHKLHTDQCADTYPSVQQTTTLQTALQNVQKMKRRTFRWYFSTMIIGLLRKHLKGHYVFMSMVYHMDYVHTHALMQTIKCPLTWTVWI